MKAFVLVLFAFLGTLAYSQTKSFSPEWAFGVNGGANLSQMRFNSRYYIPQSLYIQPEGGVMVRYISENHFGIIGELNYSMCGWKEKKDEYHPNEYQRSLNYFELPLLTHLYFNLGKRTRFIINAGPQFRYNIGEKSEAKLNTEQLEEVPPYYDENYKVNYKFDYGLKGMMGFELRTGVGSFILSGSYYFGLADVFNNAKSQPFQSSSNQIIGINLAYLIQMKK
jgi:hypothetical protein